MQTYSFEAVPTEGETFAPFVLDVPVIDVNEYEHPRAARRAWWTVFHLLGPKGFEPEDFQVFEFDADVRGREVNSKGF